MCVHVRVRVCVFAVQVESVEKLFGILTSDSVDLSLKRSATEQLAVVLQGQESLRQNGP